MTHSRTEVPASSCPRTVLALGGNAITRATQEGTYAEQLENLEGMAKAAVELVLLGHELIITHGNGPQVGNIALEQELGASAGIPALPLDAVGAMSQGYLGYMIQQQIGNQLMARGSKACCVTVISQVEVAHQDPAFFAPTKPIGRFYTAGQAAELGQMRGWNMVEDAGRGYRRVVASPQPAGTVESSAVQVLVEAGFIVVAAGGGGIPVLVENGRLRGVEAVIDKDLSAALLASSLGASTLVLLTAVDRVSVRQGTPQEMKLGVVTDGEMKQYLAEGHFPPGSMGPKVKACLSFLEGGGSRAIITSKEHLLNAVTGDVGTQIVPTISSQHEMEGSDG